MLISNTTQNKNNFLLDEEVIDIEDIRIVEVLDNNEWKRLQHFKELQVGHIFRMFESTGEPVCNHDCSEFIAMGNAFMSEDGVWTIKFENRMK